LHKFLKIFLNIIFISISVWVCYFILKQYKNITIVNNQNIKIKGNDFFTDKEIISLIDDLCINKNILSINTNEVRNRLTKNLLIESITIYKKAPSNIIINITEKDIIAKIKIDGRLYFIDNNGEKIFSNNSTQNNNIKEYFDPKLIVLYVKDDAIDFKQLNQLIENISSQLPTLYEEIESIVFYDEKIDLLSYNNDSKVIISRNNFHNDIKSLIGFIEQIENEGINEFSIANYKYINILIDNQIIIMDKSTMAHDQIIEDEIN